MSKSSAVKNFTVGLVFLGSLAVLGTATLMISSFPLFSTVEALEVHFPTVDNLQVGDNVVVNGFRVGEVKDIVYEPEKYPQAPILVRCSIPEKVAKNLDNRTEYSIRSSGALGGHYLEIKPPGPEAPANLPPPPRIGSAPGDLFQQLASFVEKNEKNINEIISDLRETMRTINSGEGALGALVKDREMGQKLTKTISDLSDKLSSEEGTIGFLLNNKQAKEDLRAAFADIRDIIHQIRTGDGIMSRLVNDSRLGVRLDETLVDVHEVVHKVNTGQGTLGQIVNNPKGWDEIMKIMVLARETIEDIREEAPISTFVNAMFAAF
jgi:phospholipid/cholesterol/gamma-HCH transport system substrate-binding protein